VPIEIQCPGCQKKLKVAEKFAGKKAKCPGCQGVLEIPALEAAGEEAAAEAAAPQPSKTPEKTPTKTTEAPSKTPAKTPAKAVETPSKTPAPKQPATKPSPTKTAPAKAAPLSKDEWFMQTEDGEQYGPVTRAELDDWVEEGRLDATCQVLCEGWEQWKWAEEVFPQLAGGEAEAAVEDEPAAPAIAVDTGAKGIAINPYASPRAGGEVEPSEAGGITRGTRRALAETRPWVLFLSILGFIGAGLSALAGISWLFLAMAAIATIGAVGAILLFMALVTLGAAGLYGFASYHLFTYSGSIDRFLRSSAPGDLERAMMAQKSFWKLVGIVTAAILGLYLVLLMAMFAMGGLGALMVR